MINRWISIRARCLSSRGSKISLNRTTSPRERILGSIIPEGWNSPSPGWRRRRRESSRWRDGFNDFWGLAFSSDERKEGGIFKPLPRPGTLLLPLLLLLSRSAPRVALSPPAKGCRGRGRGWFVSGREKEIRRRGKKS